MDELKALITECERANQRAIDELGMGLIDLNAIEHARAALVAPLPAPTNTLDLYKELCDLWREAVAVDTVIGRPAVLRQRIAALRDRVGRMQSTHLPAATAPSVEAQAAEMPAFDDLPDAAIDAACAVGGIYRIDLMRAWDSLRAAFKESQHG